jgi:hypothetical protein
MSIPMLSVLVKQIKKKKENKKNHLKKKKKMVLLHQHREFKKKSLEKW